MEWVRDRVRDRFRERDREVMERERDFCLSACVFSLARYRLPLLLLLSSSSSLLSSDSRREAPSPFSSNFSFLSSVLFVISNDDTAGTEDDAKSMLCDGSDGLLGRAEAPEASGGEAMVGCEMCETLKIKVEVDADMGTLELF